MVREQIYQESFLKQDEEVTLNCYCFSIQWSDFHFLLVQQMSHLPFWNNGNGGHCPQPNPRLLRRWPPPRASYSLAKIAYHPVPYFPVHIEWSSLIAMFLFSFAQKLLFVLFDLYVFWWAPLLSCLSSMATWYIYILWVLC